MPVPRGNTVLRSNIRGSNVTRPSGVLTQPASRVEQASAVAASFKVIVRLLCLDTAELH